MKLNDDLYVLPLPMQMGGQSSQLNLSLLLDSANGPTLVDTSIPGQSDLLAAALAEAGLRVQDLTGVILTHQDIDHVGGLPDLVRASGARVYAHSTEVPYIDGTLPARFATPAMLAQRPEMRALVEHFKWTPVDEPLEDGHHLDLAGGVRVIFTPGHTPGHMSLYLERSRTLITGDALSATDGQLSGPSEQATMDMTEAAKSVQKLAKLDVQTIVCYHGGVVRDNANEQLQRVAQSLAHSDHNL
ncbi:MAG: MBL fold metallo-hydrolase [Herpetosiphonaceae bacterium]|nr:MBL fold metallo-hydrolase [Herpetosiphonaceae bacterium]